jgi:asparaginyl-tRNA synthetase
MDLAEDFIQYVIKLDKCPEDLKFLEGRLLDEEKSKPQAERSRNGFAKIKFCFRE